MVQCSSPHSRVTAVLTTQLPSESLFLICFCIKLSKELTMYCPAGSRLVDLSIQQMAEDGCDEVCTCVYN